MSALLWGGRFSSGPDTNLIDFTSSFAEDAAIAPFDITASRAHVRALLRAGLLSAGEEATLDKALRVVGGEIESRTFAPPGQCEDIHSAIEARVCEIAGTAVGEKMHAGRSRNDQVATAIVLYARAQLDAIACDALGLTDDLLNAAGRELEAKTLIAGTTHGQTAQPILLAFWLHAAAVGIARQVRRLRDARRNLDRCPLGAGAIAGSSLAIDRHLTAAELGFGAGPTENALDTVGDRDMALESLFACAALLVHLSRIAGEIIAWYSPLAGLCTLDDSAATGSSAMPQKKNPDVFELMRAKAANVGGSLGAVLAQLKGLPLSYHRDLQEAKRALVIGCGETHASVRAFRRAFAAVRFDRARCNASAQDTFACATDLAERMVQAGIAFRSAHRTVGERIKAAEAAGLPLCGDDGAPLDPIASVNGKVTFGSTSPLLLATAIEASRAALATLRDVG